MTVDVDTIYHGFDQVLPHVDYLVASSEFPVQWTNERDPFRALEMIQEEFHMSVAAMTLGALGALARVDETDHISMRLDTRWSAAKVFELAGRSEEAKALLEESVEIAERYGHLVAAQRARERLAAGV